MAVAISRIVSANVTKMFIFFFGSIQISLAVGTAVDFPIAKLFANHAIWFTIACLHSAAAVRFSVEIAFHGGIIFS